MATDNKRKRIYPTVNGVDSSGNAQYDIPYKVGQKYVVNKEGQGEKTLVYRGSSPDGLHFGTGTGEGESYTTISHGDVFDGADNGGYSDVYEWNQGDPDVYSTNPQPSTAVNNQQNAYNIHQVQGRSIQQPLQRPTQPQPVNVPQQQVQKVYDQMGNVVSVPVNTPLSQGVQQPQGVVTNTPKKKANGSTPDNAQQLVNDEAATYMGGGTGTEPPAPNVANAFIQTQANDAWTKGNNAYNQQFNGDATGAWGTAKTMNEQQKLNIQQAQGMPLFQGQTGGVAQSDPRLSGGVKVAPQTVEDVNGKVTAGAPIDTNNIQQKQQPVTSTDIFKQYFQDEEKERKASKQRAMVGAIGDALRNIGNLYYTTQGATPQTIGVNSAAEEANKYQTDKANRQNMAYKYYTQKQNNDIAKANAQTKELLAQNTLANGESQRKLNALKAEGQELANEVTKAEAPIKVQKMVAEYNNLITEGKYKEAQTKKAEIEAEWAPLKEKATVNHINAQTESARAAAVSSYASARHMNAETQKVYKEVANMNGAKVTGKLGIITTPTKMTPMQKASMIRELYNNGNSKHTGYGSITKEDWERYTSAQGSETDENSMKSMTADELIAHCLTDCKSPGAEDIFKRYGFKIEKSSTKLGVE